MPACCFAFDIFFFSYDNVSICKISAELFVTGPLFTADFLSQVYHFPCFSLSVFPRCSNVFPIKIKMANQVDVHG